MIIFTEMNRNNNYIFSNENIINLLNKYRNFILNIYTYNYKYAYEYKKFKNYYIKYIYFNNYLRSIEYFNYSGEYHREDGPAFIEHHENDKIFKKEYCLNNKKYSYEDYILKIKKLI